MDKVIFETITKHYKTLTLVLSGNALIPMSNSMAFCMTIRTVITLRANKAIIAIGYTTFLCREDVCLCLSVNTN